MANLPKENIEVCLNTHYIFNLDIFISYVFENLFCVDKIYNNNVSLKNLSL